MGCFEHWLRVDIGWFVKVSSRFLWSEVLMMNRMKPDAVRPWQRVIISRWETYCCLRAPPDKLQSSRIQKLSKNHGRWSTVFHCVFSDMLLKCLFSPFFEMQRSEKVNPKEIEDARWFTRAEVRQMLQQQHPQGLFVPW